MTRITAVQRRVTTATIGAAAALGLAAPTPASAAGHGEHTGQAERAASVELGYERPENTESGRDVSWRWKLANTGGREALRVVVRHRLTPALRVRKLSEHCRAVRSSTERVVEVVCRYGRMPAGKDLFGGIVTAVPSDMSGNMRIRGVVTWNSQAQVADGDGGESGRAARRAPG